MALNYYNENEQNGLDPKIFQALDCDERLKAINDPVNYCYVVAVLYKTPLTDSEDVHITHEELINYGANEINSAPIHLFHQSYSRVGNIIKHYYDRTNRILYGGFLIRGDSPERRNIMNTIRERKLNGISASLRKLNPIPGTCRTEKCFNEFSLTNHPRLEGCGNIIAYSNDEKKESGMFFFLIYNCQTNKQKSSRKLLIIIIYG